MRYSCIRIFFQLVPFSRCFLLGTSFSLLFLGLTEYIQGSDSSDLRTVALQLALSFAATLAPLMVILVLVEVAVYAC